VHDDLGADVALARSVTRVVSLVPSITESIAVSCPEILVGATQWCTHPADLEVARVRGTKNPDLAAIMELAPDVVVANREENRELDVQRLREAGINVWVTKIETVPEAIASLRRLFVDCLGQQVPQWLMDANRVWSYPSRPLNVRVAVPIWRDPWMVIGRSTFAGDLLIRLGLTHTFSEHADRYPKVALENFVEERIDLVLLPDEPYVFAADDGPDAFPNIRTALISGRELTWYGPSLVDARDHLTAAIGTAIAGANT